MTAKTIAGVIAAHLEHEGDLYDFANSASIKVLGLDLQEALTAAGFGLVADAGAKALEDAADAMDKSAEALLVMWGDMPMNYSASATLSTTRHEARRVRARAAAVRGEG